MDILDVLKVLGQIVGFTVLIGTIAYTAWQVYVKVKYRLKDKDKGGE